MNQEKLIERLSAQRDALFALAIVLSFLVVLVAVIAINVTDKCGASEVGYYSQSEHADVKI